MFQKKGAFAKQSPEKHCTQAGLVRNLRRAFKTSARVEPPCHNTRIAHIKTREVRCRTHVEAGGHGRQPPKICPFRAAPRGIQGSRRCRCRQTLSPASPAEMLSFSFVWRASVARWRSMPCFLQHAESCSLLLRIRELNSANGVITTQSSSYTT